MAAKRSWWKRSTWPVLRANLAYEELKKILRSSLFFKEKFDAAGLFEKLKARLSGQRSTTGQRSLS